MRAIRNDSVEVMDVITNATGPAHVISRLLAASEERVRSVLLDPALQTIWALSGKLTTSVPSVILEQGDVLLNEFVQGNAIHVRIRLLERKRVCEMHVELRTGPSFNLGAFFELGIDDLWEARLYSITDLVMPTAYAKS